MNISIIICKAYSPLHASALTYESYSNIVSVAKKAVILVRGGPRICISAKFLGDVDTAGPGTTPGEPLIKIMSYQEQNRNMREIDTSKHFLTL